MRPLASARPGVFGEIAVVVVGSIQRRWSLQVEGRPAQLRRAVAEPIGEIAVVGVSAQAGGQNREPSRVLSFLSYYQQSVME